MIIQIVNAQGNKIDPGDEFTLYLYIYNSSAAQGISSIAVYFNYLTEYIEYVSHSCSIYYPNELIDSVDEDSGHIDIQRTSDEPVPEPGRVDIASITLRYLKQYRDSGYPISLCEEEGSRKTDLAYEGVSYYAGYEFVDIDFSRGAAPKVTVRNVPGGQKTTCPICGVTLLRDSMGWVVHMESVHGADPDTWASAGLKSASEYGGFGRLDGIGPSDDLPGLIKRGYVCYGCGDTFEDNDAVKTHLINYHRCNSV